MEFTSFGYVLIILITTSSASGTEQNVSICGVPFKDPSGTDQWSFLDSCHCVITSSTTMHIHLSIHLVSHGTSGTNCQPYLLLETAEGLPHTVCPSQEPVNMSISLTSTASLHVSLHNPERLQHQSLLRYPADLGHLLVECGHNVGRSEVKVPMRALLQNADSTMTAAIIAGSLAGGGVVLAIIIIFLVLICRRYFKKDPVVEELGNVHARTQARANTVSTISGSLKDTDTRKRQDSVTSNGSLGAQPVATYYDKKPPITNQQPHRSSGRKRKKEADRLPGGAPVALQHSISFETIYPKESKLPAKGSILRNSQRKKKRLGDTSGDSSLRDSSLSDTSNSSFEQQTSAVSLNPEGRERRPRHHHAQNSYSNLPGNQVNSSYMASPNTSQEAAFHNPAYDWTPASDNSVFDYSSQIDTSHDSETSNKKVSFAPGVPTENAKGPPKRVPKVIMTPEMMGLTKPPKYRQKHVKQPGGQKHNNLPKKGEKGSESPRVPSSPSQRHRHRTQAHGGGHVNPAFSRDPNNRPPSLRKKRKHPRQSLPPGDSNQNYAVSPDTKITAGNVLMNGHRQSQVDSTSSVNTSYAADTSANMSMDVSQQYSPQQQQVPHIQQSAQQQVQKPAHPPVQQSAQPQQATQPQPRVPPQAQQYRQPVAQPPIQAQVQQHPMPAVKPEQAPHNESYETEV